MNLVRLKFNPSAGPALAFALLALVALIGGVVLIAFGKQSREFTFALLGAVAVGASVFFTLLAMLWWPRRGAA
jgi:multisubunit Na+/H+ antiporter MnhB subunit